MQIVFLGAPRSGMSRLTRVLHLMGCRLGMTDGEAEHAERRAVVALNDELLGCADATWYDVTPQGFVDALPRIGSDLTQRAKSLIAEMDALGRPWVLKDARFSMTLPFWLQHLERPLFIVGTGNPLLSARSLRRREGFPLQAGYALWHSYVTAALHHTEHAPRVLVRSPEAAGDVRARVDQLHGDLTALGVRELSTERYDEIAAVFGDLATARAEAERIPEEAPLSSAQQELADALVRGTCPTGVRHAPLPELEREFFARERRARTSSRAMAELRAKYGRVEGANVELRQIVKDMQSQFRSAERQTGRVEEKLRKETERCAELTRQGRLSKKSTRRVVGERDRAVSEAARLRGELAELENLAAKALAAGPGGVGGVFRRLTRRPAAAEHIEQLAIRLRELQSEPKGFLSSPVNEWDPLAVMREFNPLLEAWNMDEARLTENLRSTQGLPEATGLSVRVGTLYAGEGEYEQCKRSVARQSYQGIEHVFIEHMSKKEALSTLMEGFLASSADILIKVDADMVLLDPDFVRRVVQIFATNSELQMVQMAMLDYFSGDLMQGINAYRQGLPWLTEKQDSLFTDRVKVDPKRRLVTWTTFADASIHCPNPTPFQAFHFGVHRGVKVVQPQRTEHDATSAEEQLIYLEKTYEHWRTRRDRRLGFAALGFELALTERIEVEHLTYQNPYLEERFREFADWGVQRIDQEVEALRAKPAVAPQVEPLRRGRQASVARHTAPVSRIIMLVPHLGMFGGVNRFLYLARAFARWGVDAVIAIPDDELTGTKRPTRRDDFPDVPVMPLSRAVREDWDVVLCGDRSSGVLLTMPLFRSRLSAVYLLNGWAHRLFNTRQIAAIRPDVLVACSSYAGRQYADLAPTVVPGGVALDLFFPREEIRPRGQVARIGAYPGRGREAKRFDDTIAACRVLHQRGLAFELHVYDHALAGLSDAFPIVNHGALAPADVCKVMQDIDVFISSEEDAGWCNPAAEAMAAGVPLVCTEAGTSDFAIDGETALVVPARSPELLADAVTRVLADPELAARLRLAGLERIRELDWSNVARRLLETFRAARKDAISRAALNEKAKNELVTLGVAS